MFWILIALLILGLSALLSWAIVYIHYCRTPEKRWRNRVLRLIREARRREQKVSDHLYDLDARQEEEKENLQRKAFFVYLNSISSNELEHFSGIGPKTVGKLSQAGYTNLASLQEARINIYGLGEKRVTDIELAVQEITRQAWSRFEAGGCPEAQSLKPKLEALRSKYDNLKLLSQARFKGAEAVVKELEGLIPVVRKVTILNYCRKNWNDIVPSQILEAQLPDLERTIHRAEENAKAIHRQEARQSADWRDPSKVPPIRRTPQAPRAHRPNQLPDWISGLEVVPVVPPKQSATADPVVSKAASKKRESPHKTVSSAVSAGTQVPARPPSLPVAEKKPDEIPLAIMESSIQFAFMVARARGPALAAQKALIRDYFFRRYQHDPVLSNRATAFCAQYEKCAIDSNTGFRRLNELLSTEQRSGLFELAGQVMQAAGSMDDEAAEILPAVAKKLGVPFTKITIAHQAKTSSFVFERAPGGDVKSEHRPTDDQNRAILEIDPTNPISADLVRRHFNLLHEKYNPEKVATMGPEYVEITKRKRQEILLAAQALMEQFGEKFEVQVPELPPKGMRENPDLDAAFGV